MIESGEVVKTEKNYAVVRIDRKAECARCGLCGMKKNESHVECKAKNEAAAAEGDTVLIKTDGSATLISSLLVFVMPLILLAAELAVCYVLNVEELWILIICIGTLAAWFCILALIDRKFASIRGFSPTIVRIIEKKGEEKNE